MSLASTASRLQSERTAHRTRRYRSHGFHLPTRTASRTPGEERTLERSRTPSVVYGPDALIARRPLVSWRPVKDAARPVAHPFALARAVVRIQRDADLPRARGSRSRVRLGMCPTDFCQPLFSRPAPALRVPDRRNPRPRVGYDRGIRRFTTRWIRFGGSCGDEEGCSPSRAVVMPFRASEPERCLAPLTTSPLTSRHLPGHASALSGQLAWFP